MIDKRVEGATLVEIGAAIDCSPFRVSSYYGAELKACEALRNDRVEAAIYKAAISGKSIVASIYWSKTQMKWIEASAADIRPPAEPAPDVHVKIVWPDGKVEGIGQPQPNGAADAEQH